MLPSAMVQRLMKGVRLVSSCVFVLTNPTSDDVKSTFIEKNSGYFPCSKRIPIYLPNNKAGCCCHRTAFRFQRRRLVYVNNRH